MSALEEEKKRDYAIRYKQIMGYRIITTTSKSPGGGLLLISRRG